MKTRTTGGASVALKGLTWIALVMMIAPSVAAQADDASGGPAFPVPRAEKEFRALIPDLQDYCDHVTQGDTKAFITAIGRYGPLDLQVRKASSPLEASHLRFFHLGIAAAASKMPQELASGLGQPLLDSPAHVEGRKQRLVKELPRIEAFVKRFGAVPQIALLAHWGFQGEYRVNDTFNMRGRTRQALPSPVMGFVPSGQWKDYKTPQEYLDTIHVSKSAFDGLYGAFEPLLVAAVVRTERGGTEVIALGIANNTSGLLLAADAASKPAIGQRLPDGSKYSVVDQVKPGVFYFETD